MNSILIQKVNLEGSDVDVLIQGNRISRIAPSIDFRADRIISGRNRTIIPGLVNMHTHAAMTLMRGVAEDMPLSRWLEFIWKIENDLDDDMIYWGTKLAALEMIKSGTTCFLDQYWREGYAAKACEEVGIRSNNCFVVLDKHDPANAEPIKERCMAAFESSKKWGPLQSFQVACHAPYTVSDDMFQWTSDFARKNNLLLHIHLAETISECLDSVNSYGQTPVEHLESLGVLGPEVIAAHCVWIDGDDIDILSRRKVNVVHNVNSNLKIASGYRFKYDELKQAGVNVCIGTDGAASSNNLDVKEAMKTMALLQKGWRADPKAMPIDEIMDIATVNGAKALRIDAGKVKEGALADVCLVRTDTPAFVPDFNFKSNFIYSSDSSCIDTVIVDGRIVMDERHVEGEEEIMKEAEKTAWKLCKKYL
ncbi:MAG: amidohydrolase [Bacteroidales bacterium]|jgi:5-methylthioadenosine/S-adenosylhomocysteine deaminase|nr:amidohydrolase [Bacteroidales bacterium]MCI2122148.1 amidohydrolase [Bacteroidales bacterium]MCI2146175.1 amidohydrolase [Bacteroidales bacterium]